MCTRAEQICKGFTRIHKDLVSTRSLIDTAYNARDWEKMGYSSWADYCYGQIQHDRTWIVCR